MLEARPRPRLARPASERAVAGPERMPGRPYGFAGFSDGLLACPGMRRCGAPLLPASAGRRSSAQLAHVRGERRSRSKSSAFGRLLGVRQNPFGDQSGVLPDRRLDLCGDVRIGLEKSLGVLAALADALAVVGEPGAGFLHHAGLDPEIEDLAGFGDTFAVHDVELDLFERRRELVLHAFDAGLVPHPPLALLDDADAADFEAHGSVEIPRIAPARPLP